MPKLEQMPMRTSIKLFGLVAIATVIVPNTQAPGLSETSQPLRVHLESSPVLAQVNSDSDRKAEADLLFQQGLEYYQNSQFQETLHAWEQALEIYREIGDQQGEANALNGLGTTYYSIGAYQRAEAFYQQALVIYQTILGSRHPVVANILEKLALLYQTQSDFQEALSLYQQALSIRQSQLGNNNLDTVDSLNNIGRVYSQLGDYEQALASFQEALLIAQEIGNVQGETIIFNEIIQTYLLTGEYEKALDVAEQISARAYSFGNQQAQASILNNLAAIYKTLGLYQEAFDLFSRALILQEQLGDIHGRAIVLSNLCEISALLKNLQEAKDYCDSALEIFESFDDIINKSRTLNNLANVFYGLERYRDAEATLEDSIAIKQRLGDQLGEAISLGNLGEVVYVSGNSQKALELFADSLSISTEIKYRSGQGFVLARVGHVLAKQNDVELAITFLKRAINIYEDIRLDNQSLNAELQQSFTDTIADDYRFLADLLLQENRILEAQRVLDLLKVQELDESLRSVSGSSDTETGVGFWQIEEDLLALYEQVTAESAELAALQAQDYDTLSPEQQQRLTELRQRYETVQSQFVAFLDLPEVQALLEQIEDETDRQNVDIERQHRKLQNQLRTLPQETALLYPLILPDRLELVLVTANGPPLRFPIAVAGADLNRKIVAFGQALKSPASDIQPLAQELYTILFAELEATLDQAGIESIIYAPDGALRYVPLAALHDGERYLGDRFSISHIVAASLTDFALTPDQDERQLLAAACAECSFTITVGDREFPFGDLPYTEAEVTSLAEQMPDTTVLLNQDFSLKELENRLNNYSILHLATHGAVVENAPAQSFVVLGSGEKVSLETIRNTWRLNAELVVLSACETAIGSEVLGSGVEILGLGYQIQEAGAQAVLASLWKVSDPGTQALMSAFYAALAQGMTKAEALQAAQRSMIDGSGTVSDADAPRAGARPVSRDGTSIGGNHHGCSHPYYWAPFILIGNGL